MRIRTLTIAITFAIVAGCGGQQDVEQTGANLNPTGSATGTTKGNPCDLVLCAPGHMCELDCDGGAVCNPTVCEGIAGLQCQEGFSCVQPAATALTTTGADQGGTCRRDSCQPANPCDVVLCGPGHMCELNCDGDPVCNPVVCEGFAGLQCQKGFVCDANTTASGSNPDQGGKCVESCGPTCGKCTSDADCGANQKCTAAIECLSSCDCPLCNVCAGHCVPATAGGGGSNAGGSSAGGNSAAK